jgi:hypothetical protein
MESSRGLGPERVDLLADGHPAVPNESGKDSVDPFPFAGDTVIPARGVLDVDLVMEIALIERESRIEREGSDDEALSATRRTEDEGVSFASNARSRIERSVPSAIDRVRYAGHSRILRRSRSTERIGISPLKAGSNRHSATMHAP